MSPAPSTAPATIPLGDLKFAAPEALRRAMKLSAIAYAHPGDVAKLLAEYAPDWELSWGPAVSLTNTMYGAWSATLNSYAVVVRGADPCDIREIVDVGSQVAWNYPPNTGASISAGANEGFTDLLSLTADGKGLLDWITDVVIPTTPTAALVVTGHSLGGGLASVLAPYLNWWLAQQKVAQALHVYTFAAPTAGNAQFAQLSAQAGSVNWRIYNDLDVVPLAFGNLLGIETIYSPTPCPELLELWIDAELLAIGDYVYVQPPALEYPLSGELVAGADFVSQARTQHSHNTYLELLGANHPIPPE
ncbi:MAG TPA: lipase family protein [Longimicrobiaceae bacterium]|nr:lipase family protein [Longimicrobiaceae bacterium]